jgi:hypothetical protein
VHQLTKLDGSKLDSGIYSQLNVLGILVQQFEWDNFGETKHKIKF